MTHNDKGVVNISGIEEELERVLGPYKLHNGTVFLALYGDQIYDMSLVIVQSQGVKDDFHVRMNSSRIDIEHMFGSTNNLYQKNRVKHIWKLMKMKKHVREHLFSLFFMSNVHCCFRGSKTSVKYGFGKVNIEEYLNVDMNDAYDGEDADEFITNLLNSQYYL